MGPIYKASKAKNEEEEKVFLWGDNLTLLSKGHINQTTNVTKYLLNRAGEEVKQTEKKTAKFLL